MVAIQRNISVATEADEKRAKPMDKSCVTKTFCSQLTSWDTRYKYETPELEVQTPLITFNHWKIILNYIIRFFLGGCDEKLKLCDIQINGKEAKILYFIVHFGDLGWSCRFQIWKKG